MRDKVKVQEEAAHMDNYNKSKFDIERWYLP